MPTCLHDIVVCLRYAVLKWWDCLLVFLLSGRSSTFLARSILHVASSRLIHHHRRFVLYSSYHHFASYMWHCSVSWTELIRLYFNNSYISHTSCTITGYRVSSIHFLTLPVQGMLTHEVDEGSPCRKCGDSCPGFSLHFWRWVKKNKKKSTSKC